MKSILLSFFQGGQFLFLNIISRRIWGFLLFFFLNNHSESEPEQSFQCFILSSVLTRKDDLRRKLLLIRIICLRLITSSNDFTLETIGPTFSGGCSSTALLIDGIWEIIQGYVFNKTWKTEQELAGSFSLSYHFSKSEILPCVSYNFWVISYYFLYFCSPFPKISFCFNT